MAYTTLTNVKGLMAKFSVGVSTTPTEAQATTIIDAIAWEIDAALVGVGYTLPCEGPAWFVSWLGMLTAYGAAAAILKSMFPDATGPGESPAYAFWESRYQEGLKGIRDGTIVIPDAVRGLSPSTYFTRNPDAEEDLGIIAEPFFKRGKVF